MYDRLPSEPPADDVIIPSETPKSPVLPHEGIIFLQDLEDVPQGRHLGLFSTIILFVARMVGSGIFATSSGIYQDSGRSPFWFFMVWIVAALLSFAGLYVYLELGSLVPRSGGTKPFLEFIYDRPKLLISVIFLMYSVMFGVTILNILVFGEYFCYSVGINPTDFLIRLSGLLFLFLATTIHGISVSHGIRVQNILGALKLGLLAAMIITGVYAVFVPSSISHIDSNLHWDSFFKAPGALTASSFASAVIRATFSFAGWNTVHTVSNEIKDPVRTFKIAGPASLIIVSVTYLWTNLAYLVVIPEKELVSTGRLAGSLLFEKLFGVNVGRRLLTFSIAMSAGGNVFVVLYTISRVNQEAFREGFLPFSRFFASNWPFGSPLRSLLLSCVLSTLVIALSPKGDVYNYVIALEQYPQQLFIAMAAVGVFILRHRYPDVRAPIRSTRIGALLIVLVSSYLLITPFTSRNPNPQGLEEWPSYALVAIICLLIPLFYWLVMFKIGPKTGGYTLMPEETQLSDGLTMKNWVKIYR